jgi:hypothetical protein
VEATEDLDAEEVSWIEGARQIDDSEYLFAVGLREINELTLAAVIKEAKPQAEIRAVESEAPVELLRLGARPIESDLTCRTFRVVFDQRYMVSYTVLNESYGTYPGRPEQFSGKLFRVFTWSHLLEFTKKTTCASDEHPGVLQHYQIACLNHVIDVICTGPPRISVQIPGRASQIKPTLQ